ncbi:hypothetical protein Tco_0723178 [Tanacetum coccineum]
MAPISSYPTVEESVEEHDACDEYLTKGFLTEKSLTTDNGGSGFQFTWSKSPFNPKESILKKLDRVMVNEKFLDSFQKAHVVFLPYIIFYHCPTLLTIPDGEMKLAKPFRFVSHIADKQSFLQIVEDGWKENINGAKMFQVVKKLKGLKRPLKRLNWQNSNVFEKVILLEDKLKEWQSKIDSDPTNNDVKKKVLLFSMNTRKQKVESICDEAGTRYNDDQVPKQFVKHFQMFLGKEVLVKPMVDMDDLFTCKLSVEEGLLMTRC